MTCRRSSAAGSADEIGVLVARRAVGPRASPHGATGPDGRPARLAPGGRPAVEERADAASNALRHGLHGVPLLPRPAPDSPDAIGSVPDHTCPPGGGHRASGSPRGILRFESLSSHLLAGNLQTRRATGRSGVRPRHTQRPQCAASPTNREGRDERGTGEESDREVGVLVRRGAVRTGAAPHGAAGTDGRSARLAADDGAAVQKGVHAVSNTGRQDPHGAPHRQSPVARDPRIERA